MLPLQRLPWTPITTQTLRLVHGLSDGSLCILLQLRNGSKRLLEPNMCSTKLGTESVPDGTKYNRWVELNPLQLELNNVELKPNTCSSSTSFKSSSSSSRSLLLIFIFNMATSTINLNTSTNYQPPFLVFIFNQHACKLLKKKNLHTRTTNLI